MTFDLAVWQSCFPLSAYKASLIYGDLCQGKRHVDLVPNAEALAAFYADLTEVWPDVAGAASKMRAPSDTPWAAPILRSESHVLLSSRWEHAEIVLALLTALAGKHGLIVFDPQSEEVHAP